MHLLLPHTRSCSPFGLRASLPPPNVGLGAVLAVEGGRQCAPRVSTPQSERALAFHVGARCPPPWPFVAAGLHPGGARSAPRPHSGPVRVARCRIASLNGTRA